MGTFFTLPKQARFCMLIMGSQPASRIQLWRRWTASSRRQAISALNGLRLASSRGQAGRVEIRRRCGLEIRRIRPSCCAIRSRRSSDGRWTQFAERSGGRALGSLSVDCSDRELSDLPVADRLQFRHELILTLDALRRGAQLVGETGRRMLP